jgi:hypothetical protein
MKTNRTIISAVASIALVASTAIAQEYDLTPRGSQSFDVPGDVGGTAVISDFWEQPTGTGVFDPFLSLDANGQTSVGNNYVEQAYNTDGFTALYLDEHRPQWNNLLTYGDLATINKNGIDYKAFILDANEPGGKKSLISIDNIRIYTSATDNTASVADDITQLDNLGTLRWAMNEPLATGPVPPDSNFNVDTWVKLDARQENVSHGNANGGSGQGDMIVYIPVSAFGDALATDFVWMYNLNGVHYTSDVNNASESGFEEWRAVMGTTTVPDGGSTLALFGLGLLAVGVMGRRLRPATQA